MPHKPLLLLLSFITFHLAAQSNDATPIDPNQTLLKSIFFGGGSAYIDGEQELESIASQTISAVGNITNGSPNSAVLLYWTYYMI